MIINQYLLLKREYTIEISSMIKDDFSHQLFMLNLVNGGININELLL